VPDAFALARKKRIRCTTAITRAGRDNSMERIMMADVERGLED
jgi:hypothetical protein